MARSRELIYDIKERAAEIFEAELGLRLNRAENAVHCPFHGDDRTPSMGVNIVKGMFNCLACGASGDVLTFVMRLNDLTFPEAVKKCAAQLGLDPDEEYDHRRVTAEHRREERELLWALHQWASQTASAYAVRARLEEKALFELESRLKDPKLQHLPVFHSVLQKDCNYQRVIARQMDQKFQDFVGSMGDPWRQAVLFGEEYGLSFESSPVRAFNDALLECWERELEGDREIRSGELLALAVLRQFPNGKLLKELGRGWYVDVELSYKQSDWDRGDDTGNLDLGSPDCTDADSGGAVQGPRVGDRALAEAARAAVERSDDIRREVRQAFEREAAKVDAGRGPRKAAG